MISNGFQARLLNSDLVSIEETFALTPACSLFEGKSGSAASSLAGNFQDQSRKATFPSISIDCYSPAYRPKALSVVRRGAVFVTPVRSTTTPSASNEAGTSQVLTTKENKLYLAFRWAGSEHSNAECANVLGDIAQANLQPMRGIGLTQSNAISAVEEEAAPLPGNAPSKEKSSKTKSRSLLFPWKKSTQDGKKKATSSRKGTESIKDQPFLAQLYFDNKLIPLTSTESKGGDQEKQLSTVQLVGGALLDLGVLGGTLPDAPANEILHTITLHLWDATRPDVHVGPAFKSGHQVRWGPKKTVVPNVIFHFEVVSSGPQEAVRVRKSSTPVTSPRPSPSLKKSALIEDFSAPLPSEASLGRLASVAEESSLRSAETDELSLTPPASRHAKMRKAAAIAAHVIKPRPRTSSLPVEGTSRASPPAPEASVPIAETPTAVSTPDAKPDEINESTFKTFMRKVTSSSRPDSAVSEPAKEEAKVDIKGKSVQIGEPQQLATQSIPRVKRVPVPSVEGETLHPRRSIPLIRVVSTGSNRSNHKSSKGESIAISEAKRISLLGTKSNRQEELCQGIEQVEVLKREHIQIESERRLLEEQWNKTLLKSLDEDYGMLKKRVEMGKQEVDILRNRMWPTLS